MKRVARIVALLIAGATLAGCTFVPTDSRPQVVNHRSVPFNLLTKTPQSRSTTL